MPNMIKLPIIFSGVSSNLVPRFTCLNAEDVYAVSKAAASGSVFDVIHVHYAKLAVASDSAPLYLRASINYTDGGSQTVTDQDIENLKNLITSANQKPGLIPEFELIGARSATSSTITDFQVADIQIKAEEPYSSTV
jgi:hypothetical protein